MIWFRHRRWSRALMLAVLLSAAPAISHAAADLDSIAQGPKIGASMGSSVGAVDQGGQDRDFKSLARRRGLIILFARSFDW